MFNSPIDSYSLDTHTGIITVQHNAGTTEIALADYQAWCLNNRYPSGLYDSEKMATAMGKWPEAFKMMLLYYLQAQQPAEPMKVDPFGDETYLYDDTVSRELAAGRYAAELYNNDQIAA